MSKNYLPSKIFIIRFVALIAIVGVAFGVYKLALYYKNRPQKVSTTQPQVLSVSSIVQKDSNGNGIPDWEEELWGLDPTKNGDTNKAYILAQQKAVNDQTGQNTVANTDVGNVSTSTQNDALSAEFFALILSLQQSGNTSDATIQSMTDALGKTIIPKPITDAYTPTMQTIISTATKTQTTAYFKTLQDLLTTYTNKNMGKELTFISQGLQNKDPQALALAANVGLAYRGFAKDLIKVPVPSADATTILSLCNDYDKIGQSVEGMSQVLQDPIIGMQSLINYKKYNDAAQTDAQALSQNS
jgi:hypothetical protein